MSNWNSWVSGLWTTPVRWSGLVPINAGSVADFTYATAVSGTINVTLSDTSDIRVGSMTVSIAGTGQVLISGSLNDSGADVADLIFDNAASNALLTAHDSISFSSLGGLRLRLDSTLAVNTVNSDAFVSFSAPISGSGGIIKTGYGALQLLSVNTFTGGLTLAGGTVYASSASAFGTGPITFNAANAVTSSTLVTQWNGTLATSISTTAAANSLPAGIAAATGTTVTLTGAYNQLSATAYFIFGDQSNSGTIIADFSSIALNSQVAAHYVGGGTLMMGSAYAAATLLNGPTFWDTTTSVHTTTIVQSGQLDTGGFETTVVNGFFNANAQIRSSNGPLDLILKYYSPESEGSNQYVNSRIFGTNGIDSIEVHVNGMNGGFAFAYTASQPFENWNKDVDLITIHGSAGANIITGSIMNDVIYGNDGNDVLSGGRSVALDYGQDRIYGGNGDDTIIPTEFSNGTMVHGGAGTDTLSIVGDPSSFELVAVTLAEISGFEILNFVDAGVLSLSMAQLIAGFGGSLTVTGYGRLNVYLAPGDVFTSAGITLAVGSSFALGIYGTLGNDTVKAPLSAYNTIEGMAGNDRLRGGNLGDVINGGDGNDKILGLGQADDLTGGAGADQYRYLFAADSGTGGSADRIHDFVSGTDRLNFALLDADPLAVGHQAITFINTAAFASTGQAQVRWADLGDDLLVQLDLDGDGASDMEVLLINAGTQTLTAADFML